MLLAGMEASRPRTGGMRPASEVVNSRDHDVVVEVPIVPVRLPLLKVP